ncbi:MAG: DNA mismatch endonuclease Vsr [Phycisphaerales bacterium]|nr:DNA mismatch endonuclease Vsr [Phycisphaerales bacterium]
MDRLSQEERSENMRRVRNCDTGPELTVRRLAHNLGYRYRLHRNDLPGCPDLVFPRRMCVIFVHGCFWHRHNCRRGNAMPGTRTAFWKAKFEATARRDRHTVHQLRRKGWRVLIVWECQTRDHNALQKRIRQFLGPY